MWNPGWECVFSTRDWGKYPAIEVVRLISRAFGQAPDRNCVEMLEIGCGTGANVWFVAREGFRAAGIDGSPTAIEKLRRRLDDEGLDAELHVGDAMTLPFADDRFDCVIDCECLYSNSLADAAKMLEEVRRVLKPGGKLISITFMTGTYGDGLGERLPGESNTYARLHGGGLRQDCGLVRFTAEEDIPWLYGRHLTVETVEYAIRSEKNRAYEIREWVITCAKPLPENAHD